MTLQYFEPNQRGRDFVVGDIHGKFTKLEDRLESIGFDFDNDRLFSTGDLVDRGPESHRALEFLAEPWFFAIQGNHEDMAIGYASGDRTVPGIQSDGLYDQNGGRWAMELGQEAMMEFAKVFAKLPLRIQVGDVGIIHAQAPIDWLIPDSKIVSIWKRDRVYRGDETGTKNISKVYLGHTPVRERLQLGNNIYIDTASFDRYRTFTIEQI